MTNHPNRSKTPQFHEGQEVEVYDSRVPKTGPIGNWQPTWRKAKIVNELRWYTWAHSGPADKFTVQFPDGTRAVVDAEHIRDGFPLDNHQMRFGSSPIGK